MPCLFVIFIGIFPGKFQGYTGAAIVLCRKNLRLINISFERLFGKLISLQDTLAVIISDRTNRTIKKVVHFTGMSFLPVGL